MVTLTARVRLFVLLLSALFVGTADAQIRDRLRDAARQALARPSEPARMSVEEILERATRCRYDDAECIERAKSANQLLVLTDANGEVLEDSQGRPIDDPSKITPQQRAQLLRRNVIPAGADSAQAAAARERPNNSETGAWLRSCSAFPPSGLQPEQVAGFCRCLVDDLVESIAAGTMKRALTRQRPRARGAYGPMASTREIARNEPS